jgi:phosphoribosylformimino-5-aminoimidazole carboxamide ribotide isomerase
MMQIIPAIDIRNGQCVRLLKGDFEQVTEYKLDPRDLALQYRAMGAEWLHIVDLDGAASGKPANAELIREIAAASSLRIQIGGGIRTREDLDAVLEYADRAVVGSLAILKPELVGTWLASVGLDRITIGLDVKLDHDGEALVTTHGWTRESGIKLAQAIELYQDSGLKHILCTDVDKDGALAGPNFELYQHCARTWRDLEFQASGGVRNADDLVRLASTGVAAAISGKALLENMIDPEDIQAFLPNA